MSGKCFKIVQGKRYGLNEVGHEFITVLNWWWIHEGVCILIEMLQWTGRNWWPRRERKWPNKYLRHDGLQWGITSHWSEWPSSKNYINNKWWRACGEKRTLLQCWWECKLVQPQWRTVWRFLKKTKIEPPYDSETPLLGIYPEKTIIQRHV